MNTDFVSHSLSFILDILDHKSLLYGHKTYQISSNLEPYRFQKKIGPLVKGRN